MIEDLGNENTSEKIERRWLWQVADGGGKRDRECDDLLASKRQKTR